MNAEQGLKLVRDALLEINNGVSEHRLIAIVKRALADTASIELPEVASVDTEEFEALLSDLARRQRNEVIEFVNAHCAQQVAAELDPVSEKLTEVMGRFIEATNERDDLRAQLAARIELGEPVAWMTNDGRVSTSKTKEVMPNSSRKNFNIPLYAAPQPAPVSDAYPLDVIAQACVATGLGVLQCQTLLSAIKGEMSDAQKALIAKARAPSQPAPVCDERAAFEAWTSSKDGLAGQSRWHAWQASAALHRTAASVTEGWPTDGMIDRGTEFLREAGIQCDSENHDGMYQMMAAGIFHAMIAAAPAQLGATPAQEGEP